MSSLVTVGSQPGTDWDSYLDKDSEAPIYLRGAWTKLICDVFRQRAWFIHARAESGKLLGVLPLVRQHSLLLGRFVTSLPYFNYGGTSAISDSVARELMAAGQQVAMDEKCKYLELRGLTPIPMDGWEIRTDKVTMIRSLPTTAESLKKELGAKIRAQVNRPNREQVAVETGTSRHLVDQFYDVFCRNMRDLGTPVYPRRFFHALVQQFPTNCVLVVVRRGAVPAAAGFLIKSGSKAEIPWAACRSDAKPNGFNMRLYWEVLNAAIDLECRTLDFGRCSKDSGTYRFKRQWGANEIPLYWHRWTALNNSSGHVQNPDQGRGFAVEIWKRLPLPVANSLGPLISPSLPW